MTLVVRNMILDEKETILLAQEEVLAQQKMALDEQETILAEREMSRAV